MLKSTKKWNRNNIRNRNNYNVKDNEISENNDNDSNNIKEKESDYHDSIKSYLKDISHYHLLTADQEKELSKRIENDDQEALNEMINSNLRLVIKIAKAFISKEYPLIDVIQDGNIGLIRAAQKFDYRRNVRFSTYASKWIKQMIIRSLSQKKRVVRLPYRKERILKNIKEFSNKFMDKNKRYPTNSEISEELEMPIKEIKKAKSYDISVSSLEDTLNSEENNFSLEKVVGNTTNNPYDKVVDQDLKSETFKALNTLYPKERIILIYRFGLASTERYTLKQMGNFFGISAETVRQIEIKTLKKLKVNHTYLKGYICQ